MKRFVVTGLVAALPLSTLSACDESTSGADREADESPRSEAGKTGSGGSGGKGGSSSSGGASGRGGDLGGTTSGTGTVAGRGGASGGGGAGGSSSGVGGMPVAGTSAGMSAAGTGAGAGGQAGGRTLEEQIVRSADRDCQKLAACSPTLLARFYGTLAGCRSEQEKLLRWHTSLTGSGMTVDSLERCVEDYVASDCTAYFSTIAPASCRYQGQLANGAGCMSAEQCASGFCRFGSALCGVCEPPPAEGAACAVAADCPNMVCTPSGTCAKAVPQGAACGATSPCDTFLVCRNTCEPRPATAGAPCGSLTGYPACDIKAGFLCSSATQGTCLTVVTASAGESCNGAEGTATLCTPFGLCQEGTCFRGPGVGEACNASEDRLCAPSQYCNAGFCSELPDPRSCDAA